MLKPRLRIATASIAFALVLGGGGSAAAASPATAPASVSGQSVSATAWTHTVCQSLSAWETNVKSLSSSISGQVQHQSSVAGVRKILTKFLQKVVDATSKLIRQTDGAGTPKVDHGKEVAQFFHDGLTQLKNLFSDSVKTTKNLPNDPQAFATQAEALGTQIDNGGKTFQSTFDNAKGRFNIPDIDAAFSSDPACTAIHQSS